MVEGESTAVPGAGRARRGDAVYRALKQQIILSTLKDGQALPELEIAAAMGCSQGTVREALLRLQDEGLVLRQGYRGSVVSPVSPIEARAFLHLRAELESQALAHSVPSLRPQDLEGLADRVRAMEALAQAGDEYGLFEADQAFHIALFQLAPMPALVPVLVRCSLYNHRNKISLKNAPRTLQETAARHWRIVDALRAGGVAEAQRVLRHHVQSVTGKGADAPTVSGSATVSAMSPEQRAIVDAMQAEDGHLPVITTLPRAQALAQFEHTSARWNGLDPDTFALREESIPAPVSTGSPRRAIGLLRVRHRTRFDPRRGWLVYLHGGGWVFGSPRTHQGAMARLADLTGCEVVGVDYGLAPDHPFPQGLNDCVWAWRWLRARAAPQDPCFIAGDSAGANLALATLLDLRHLGEPMPDAALLFYGVYDADHDTASHRQFGGGDFRLSTERMHWYRSQYLSGSRRDPHDPRVSPARADLADLPPLFLNLAGLDPLRDDTLALVARLSATNTPFQLHRYEGVVHGFMQMSSRLAAARLAFEDAAAFIRSRQPAGLPAL
jgi:acetyl esterase/lipase/DNA-binding GntR family transcriptional regulator